MKVDAERVAVEGDNASASVILNQVRNLFFDVYQEHEQKQI